MTCPAIMSRTARRGGCSRVKSPDCGYFSRLTKVSGHAGGDHGYRDGGADPDRRGGVGGRRDRGRPSGRSCCSPTAAAAPGTAPATRWSPDGCSALGCPRCWWTCSPPRRSRPRSVEPWAASTSRCWPGDWATRRLRPAGGTARNPPVRRTAEWSAGGGSLQRGAGAVASLVVVVAALAWGGAARAAGEPLTSAARTPGRRPVWPTRGGAARTPARHLSPLGVPRAVGCGGRG